MTRATGAPHRQGVEDGQFQESTPGRRATHDVHPRSRRSVVELRNVTKTFGKITAVRDLTLALPERSICGFIGPNGSGKTTTLRMLMRIYRPDEGAGLIRVLGYDGLHTPADLVGYLPEERGLYKRMNVCDVLAFYAELKGCRDIKPLVRGWLQRMRLEDAANRRVEALSKGMAQKVQFIAAVINKPPLIILDEPFSGLDPVNADVLRQAVLDLKDEGVSIIYSTHDMHMAEKMCDYLVMMYQGDKVLDGTIDEIRKSYGADTLRVRLRDANVDLSDINGVTAVSDYGRTQELRMADESDAQRILRDIMDRTPVLQFEVTTPSLHDVFVRIAGPKAREQQHA